MEQSPNIGQMIILTSFHAVYVSAHAPQGYVLSPDTILHPGPYLDSVDVSIRGVDLG